MTYESGADLSGVDFEDLVAEMIRRCGDTPDREGMMKTPDRVAKAMAFLTKGYGETPDAVVGDAIYLPDGRTSAAKSRDVGDPPLCLHAQMIELTHPTSGETVQFEAQPPAWAM